MRRALLLTLAVAVGLGAWALLRRSSDPGMEGPQDRALAHPGGQGDLRVGKASEADGPPPGQPRLGGSPKDVEVRGGTLVGRVLRPGGIPAAGALVGAGADGASARATVETRTAADGTFRLVGLPTGLLRVRASWAEEDSQLETMAFATADTDELELRLLPRVWELRVRVVDRLGVLIPTFRCRVLTSEAMRTARGKAGMAVLKLGTDWLDHTKIDPGEQPTFVVVWDARDGEGRALDCGVARVGPIEAQGEELRVSLPAGRALRGRLLRPDGTPGAGSSVFVNVADGGKDVLRDAPAGPADVSLQDIDLELTTDDQGRFDCARLSPTSSHSVRVQQWTGTNVLPLERMVGPAEDIGDLHLRAALTVEVRVLDADGAPQLGVLVWAVPIDHDSRPSSRVLEARRSLYSDIHGVATLTGLDPEARYDLDVIPPHQRDVREFRLLPEQEEYRREIQKAVGLGRVRLPDWRPRPEVVRLPLARPLEGLVEDEDGQPVDSAFVEVRDVHGWRWVVQANADGGFQLAQPPAGPLLLRAALEEDALGNGAAGAPVRIEEGARGGVRLSVALAGSVVVIVRGDRLAALDRQHLDRFTPIADDPLVLQLGGSGWSAVPAAVVALATPADEQRAAKEAGEAVRCYRIVGLRPGALHALWQDLRMGDYLYGEIPPAARVLRLRTEPGESIRVRVRGVAADGVVELVASDALGRIVRHRVSLDAGEASVEGLPRGAWDVQVTATLARGRLAVSSGRAQTGSVLELDLAAPIR